MRSLGCTLRYFTQVKFTRYQTFCMFSPTVVNLSQDPASSSFFWASKLKSYQVELGITTVSKFESCCCVLCTDERKQRWRKSRIKEESTSLSRARMRPVCGLYPQAAPSAFCEVPWQRTPQQQWLVVGMLGHVTAAQPGIMDTGLCLLDIALCTARGDKPKQDIGCVVSQSLTLVQYAFDPTLFSMVFLLVRLGVLRVLVRQ